MKKEEEGEKRRRGGEKKVKGLVENKLPEKGIKKDFWTWSSLPLT